MERTRLDGYTRLLSATSRAVIQALLMLVAFYFLLTDGERLVGWLERVARSPRVGSRVS
jgi:predicted PurR-regulated permease PerM